VLLSPFPASKQRERCKEKMKVVEKEQESALEMSSTSLFTQANMQHSIAASCVISRAVSVKGIYITLV
jgi:hypothetical protein